MENQTPETDNYILRSDLSKQDPDLVEIETVNQAYNDTTAMMTNIDSRD